MKKIKLISAATVTAICSALCISTVVKETVIRRLPEGFTVTAHTGCEGTKDNSLESITKGAEAGADIVEIDLHFLDDGTPVLSHNKPDGKTELPTFESALQALCELDIRMNIDVKATDNMAEVYSLIKNYNLLEKVFFTGIEEIKVPVINSAAPGIPYFLNVDVDKKKNTDFDYLNSLVEKVRECGAIGINMKFTGCSDELVRFFRSEGLLVSLWTANKKKNMLSCIRLKPDNITTRKPSVLKSIINEK